MSPSLDSSFESGRKVHLTVPLLSYSMLCFYKTAIEARTPFRGSRRACGIDLPLAHSVTIAAGCKVSLDTFIQVSLPEGHFGLLKLRSGAAKRHSLILHGGVIGKHAASKMAFFLNCLFISRRRFLWQHSTSSSEHRTDTHPTPRRRCVRTVNTCEVLLWTSLGRQGLWLQLRPRSFGFWVYGRLQGQFVSVNRRSRPSRGPIPSTKPAWS